MMTLALQLLGLALFFILSSLAFKGIKRALYSHSKIKMIVKCMFYSGAALLFTMMITSASGLDDAALFATIMFLKLIDMTIVFVFTSIVYLVLRKCFYLLKSNKEARNGTGIID